MEVLIGGKYYPGTVKKVGGDGTCAVDFDDGDKDPRVAEEHMRPLGGAAAAEETPAAAAAPTERLVWWLFIEWKCAFVGAIWICYYVFFKMNWLSGFPIS